MAGKIPFKMGLKKKNNRIILDTGFNKTRVLSNFIGLTAIFSLFYICVSWMIDYIPGIIVMSCNFVIFWINYYLFKLEKLNYRYSANLYIANCIFVAISLCTFYSGGIFSPVLPWFILIPTISLLLLGISRNTYVWLTITIVLVILCGVLAQLGFVYPNAYNHWFWDKIFTTTCVFGLALIVFLVTYVFESIKEKALFKLAEKNKEITDSIQYARSIQQALLAPAEFVDRHLPENFVLYKPKDIVSGDFYWAREYEDSFYLAVCDCTGHGVPGAFMSLLITSFLNEAITEKKITLPHEIFNFVKKRVVQNTAKNGSQDGMDGTIIRLNKTTGKINFASANGYLITIENGEMIKQPKDKMPVGRGYKTEPFNLYETTLKKGDMMYFYTDGFPDLFGGPKGKKFASKKLNQLLLEISHLPLEEQKQKLESAYHSWKGSLEQIDDICILGFRL